LSQRLAHAGEQLVAFLANLRKLLPDPLQLGFEPPQSGIGFAHPAPKLLGLQPVALNLYPGRAQLGLEPLDDAGRGIFGHATQDAAAEPLT